MNSESNRDVEDLPKENPKNRSTGTPDVRRDDDTITGGHDSVVDLEPGPDDDDGLPENARRRVPS
jgi:hypothetical protein